MRAAPELTQGLCGGFDKALKFDFPTGFKHDLLWLGGGDFVGADVSREEFSASVVQPQLPLIQLAHRLNDKLACLLLLPPKRLSRTAIAVVWRFDCSTYYPASPG